MNKIDNFFLGVDDLNACKAFYHDILGLGVKFDFSDHGMLAFQIGQDEPAIILKDRQHFPDAKPCLWIEVEDVHTTYQQLKDKGVNFLTEPFKIRTGWAVEFLDPSGNRLGITDYNADSQ